MTTRYHQLIRILNSLHAVFKPFKEQIEIGNVIFSKGAKRVFLSCGRKFGKTELINYILWRYALINSGIGCYYIAPFLKQAKEINWASNRLQTFCDASFISKIDNSELRITFTNGSFIKLDGSDNYEAYRGVNPHLVIYEEFKDFHPRFHEAMEPNLATHNAPLIIIGTPPARECQFTMLAEEFRRRPNSYYFEFKTECNPYIDKGWLAEMRRTLEERGELDVWYREYEGKFVKGGSRAVFPMLNEGMVVRDLYSTISRDLKKLQWICIADPGTITCHAQLFMAVNPYNKEVYCLDEIYETKREHTSIDQIGNLTIKIESSLWAGDWLEVYDCAASWFQIEMSSRFGHNFIPSDKFTKSKEAMISTIRDMMRLGKLKISDKCKKLYWELENYVTDDNGEFPKKNDHLIDCLRYGLMAINYDLNSINEPTSVELLNSETKRFYTIEDDFIDKDEYECEIIEQW